MVATRRVVVGGALGLAGAWSARPVSAAAPLKVLATTGMIADVARVVGGDLVVVTALMGPGVDPHLYKATRSDIAAMVGADVVFYNGLLLEGRMTDALVRVAGSGRAVTAVTEQIDEAFLLEPEDFGGHFDPHVWMDPVAWRNAVDVIRDRLAGAIPDGATAIRERGDAYAAELAALDAYAREALGGVPAERRLLVTAHDAFNYFGRRYGFQVRGIQGISTESEAGLQQIERLVSLLVDRAIPAVFVESTIPERSVRALIAGAAARNHTVAIGGELFSDAMGRPGSYEGTYLGMIDHNVTLIARALGGSPPAGGRLGQLTVAAR